MLYQFIRGGTTLPPQLTLLCCGTATGSVELWANGVMHVAQLAVGAGRVALVRASPDLRSLATLAHDGDAAALTLLGGAALWEHRGELAMLACSKQRCDELHSALRDVAAQMRDTWLKGGEASMRKLGVLGDMLRDEARPLSLHDEFFSLASVGRASPTMRQFLSNSMGEQTIRRLQGGMRQAFAQLRLQCDVLLASLLESLLACLEELDARAHLHERFAPLLWQPARLQHVLALCRLALLQVGVMSRAIDVAATRYAAFWEFLADRAMRINAEDEAQTGLLGNEHVLAFVRHELARDTVLPLLDDVEPCASPPSVASSGARQPAELGALAAQRWQAFLAQVRLETDIAAQQPPSFRACVDTLGAALAAAFDSSERVAAAEFPRRTVLSFGAYSRALGKSVEYAAGMHVRSRARSRSIVYRPCAPHSCSPHEAPHAPVLETCVQLNGALDNFAVVVQS